MLLNEPNNTCIYIVLAFSTTLGACGWVDSAGENSVSENLNNTATRTLYNAQSVDLTENVPTTARLVGEGEGLAHWQWQLTQNDVTDRCQQYTGSLPSKPLTDLTQACSNDANCDINVEEFTDTAGTGFTITMPALKAPVALHYTLTNQRSDGATLVREQVLCGLSINEAPDAQDDRYAALLGSVRQVAAGDSDSLLSNDTDDIDSQNQPLRVLTTPLQAPLFAAQFSLGENGGFIYESKTDITLSDSATLEDSFVYQVTDGVHISQATVSIVLSAQNKPPLQLSELAALELTEGQAYGEEISNKLDLSTYFSDPENDTLTFTSLATAAPLNEVFKLGSNGRLSILAENTTAGFWVLPFSVTDGVNSVSGQLDIVISPSTSSAPLRNSEPVVDDINNRVVQNSFTYNVAPFFIDPDGDLLSYTSVGLPPQTIMTTSGIISGVATSENRGQWFVVVTAEDPYGNSTSDGFLLIVN